MGVEGFSAESSLLYHRHLADAITAAEPGAGARARAPTCPLLPRHLRTHDLPTGGDTVAGRHLLLANDDVRISYAVAQVPATCTATPR